MSVRTSYKNNLMKKAPSNLVLFVGENFNNLSILKKHVSKYEYSFIIDLLKSKDQKKSIITLDINSQKKITLVSFKKNIKLSDVENLGAKLYDLSSDIKQVQYIINSDTSSSNSPPGNWIPVSLHLSI